MSTLLKSTVSNEQQRTDINGNSTACRPRDIISKMGRREVWLHSLLNIMSLCDTILSVKLFGGRQTMGERQFSRRLEASRTMFKNYKNEIRKLNQI